MEMNFFEPGLDTCMLLLLWKRGVGIQPLHLCAHPAVHFKKSSRLMLLAVALSCGLVALWMAGPKL